VSPQFRQQKLFKVVLPGSFHLVLSVCCFY